MTQMPAGEEHKDASTFDSAAGVGEPSFVDLNPLLDAMLAVRGATAAAIVTQSAEVVASRSLDRSFLERTVEIITSALAAGQALGELLDPSNEDGAGAPDQVTLIFGEGPIILRPVPGVRRVLVLALASEQDLGRARLMLRGSLGRLAESTLAGR
ncbi:MAG: roadblock/LC7 domain-containing protein [Trueperaceae bacterium]